MATLTRGAGVEGAVLSRSGFADRVQYRQDSFGTDRGQFTRYLGGAVAALMHDEVPTPGPVALLGIDPVRVQRLGDPPGDVAQQDRVHFGGVGQQSLLYRLVVFGLNREGQGVDRLGDHQGVGGRDHPSGLGGRDRGKHRRQHLPGQGAVGAEIGRRLDPVDGLPRADPQQLAEQARGITTGTLAGQAPRVELTDQRVIHHSKPPLLRLQIPQQVKNVVTG